MERAHNNYCMYPKRNILGLLTKYWHTDLLHIDSVGAPNGVLLSGDEAKCDPELPWVFPWHQQVIVAPFTYTYQLHRNHVSSHLASSWSNHQWLTTDYDFSFSTPLTQFFRSTYDSPYDTYESDADLSHLIGNAAQGQFSQLHFFLQAQLELQE